MRVQVVLVYRIFVLHTVITHSYNTHLYIDLVSIYAHTGYRYRFQRGEESFSILFFCFHFSLVAESCSYLVLTCYIRTFYVLRVNEQLSCLFCLYTYMYTSSRTI